MLDTTMIQTRGFRNLAPGEGFGGFQGFQVRVRSPYYRGLWTSLLDGATVTVDGERTEAADVTWSLGDADYSLAQLQASGHARWALDAAATLLVPRDRPLDVGPHAVSVEIAARMSYIPLELQPTLWSETRNLVITR